jgi:hypothetical protein
VLLRCTQGLIAQIGQTAVCYRQHSVEQQPGRWVPSTVNCQLSTVNCQLPTGRLAASGS